MATGAVVMLKCRKTHKTGRKYHSLFCAFIQLYNFIVIYS